MFAEKMVCEGFIFLCGQFGWNIFYEVSQFNGGIGQ